MKRRPFELGTVQFLNREEDMSYADYQADRPHQHRSDDSRPRSIRDHWGFVALAIIATVGFAWFTRRI